MSSDEAEYIMVPNPNNPSQRIKARLLAWEKTSGEDYEFKLKDGTRIKLI
jgi:hypothetical protein